MKQIVVLVLGLAIMGCATQGEDGPSAAEPSDGAGPASRGNGETEQDASTSGESATADTSAADGDVLPGIDAVVTEAARLTVRLMPAAEERTLAVYYFDIEGAPEALGDYLINGLTTEIANRARGRTRVVTRGVLDRLMEELSFQASDLADEGSRRQLGRQLGADVVLTGFVTPFDGELRLNAQLVEVETGVVLGGFRLRFAPEDDFTAPDRPAGEASSGENVSDGSSVSVDGSSASVDGSSASVDGTTQNEQVIAPIETEVPSGRDTQTVIVENFDRGRPRISMQAFDYFWGPRVVSSRSTVVPLADGGIDASAAQAGEFRVSFDEAYSIEGFADTDIQFHVGIEGLAIPEEADGVALSVLPDEARHIVVAMVDTDNANRFEAGLTVNRGEWNDLRMPFAVLVDESGAPFEGPAGDDYRLEVWASFSANYQNAATSLSNSEAHMRLAVDNVGYFRFLEAADGELIDSFDSDVHNWAFTAYMYGITEFVDYRDDGGGVTRAVEGINSYTLEVLRGALDGDEYVLSLRGELVFDDRFAEHLEEGGYLSLLLYGNAAGPWQEAEAIRLYARSDGIPGASLEAYDMSGGSAYADVALSPVWSPLRVPVGDGFAGEWAYLDTRFLMPGDAILEQTTAQGSLYSFSFRLDLDDLRIE